MKHILIVLLPFFGGPLLLAEETVSPESTRVEQPAAETTIYSPVGKRDPFRPPSKNTLSREVASTSPLERFNVEQLQLRAILRSTEKNQAMFEDPEGKTHIVGEGMILGRERATVSRILNTEVILTERTINYLGVEGLTEKVLSLEVTEEEPIGAKK